MSNESLEEQTERSVASVVKTVVLVLVIGAVLLLLIFAASRKPSNAEKVWDQATTVGNIDAKNHYIMYTDIMCPYCDVFSRLIIEQQENFDQYIAENDILFELRVTDTLYEASGIKHSRTSAEGAYCAKREGKFWDYYHEAVMSLWADYHSKGIGDSKTSPQITGMTEEYWYKVGHKVGLGEDFDNCMDNHETVAEIQENTVKAARSTNGAMPYFQFNDFVTSGFDPSWDYNYVLYYLRSGLGEIKN